MMGNREGSLQGGWRAFREVRDGDVLHGSQMVLYVRFVVDKNTDPEDY